MKPIKVLIVDDHALVRMGLAALLGTEDGIEVVGEAEDGAAAVRQTLCLKPDVVVMDLMMPDMDGIAATAAIKGKSPKTTILILTTTTIPDDIVRAIRAGASGAVAKSSDNAWLIAAIRKVASGEQVVAPEIEKLLSEDPPVPALTERQSEILEAVTRGLTNADIARQFDIRESSVKEHVNQICTKLGAANRAEAVAIALRKHLLKI